MILLEDESYLKEVAALIPWRIHDLYAYAVDKTVGRKLCGPSDDAVKGTCLARLHLEPQFNFFAGGEAQFLILGHDSNTGAGF